MREPKSDEDLMLLITEKSDKQAFDLLYHRYSKSLHYFFYRMLGADSDLADDFLQELFIKVIEKGYLFNKERKFKTWLYFIAGNMCKNEYRRKDNAMKSHEEYTIMSQGQALNIHHGHIDSRSFSRELNECIDNLESIHKEVIVLRYQQELSVKEIAEIIECSEGTIKSRIHYALQKLEKELAHYREGLTIEVPQWSKSSINNNLGYDGEFE